MVEVYYLDSDEYEEVGIPCGLEEKMNPDVIGYWYIAEPYEGYGQMVFHTNDGWYSISLNHCSCYGPGEYWEKDLDAPTKTVKEILGEGSLLDLLEIHGWK